MADLNWIDLKIRQFLEKSPYSYTDYYYNNNPILIYENFIIEIKDETSIVIGVQPYTLDKKEVNILKEKLSYIIDNVEIRYL